MIPVPRVAFRLPIPDEEAALDAPGADLAEALRRAFADKGLPTSSAEPWEGAGWRFEVELGGKAFELYFAEHHEAEWLLALAPLGEPGLLGRLLGHKPFPVREELEAACQVVQEVLTAHPDVADLAWSLDEHPSRREAVRHPARLPWPQTV